MLLDKSLWKEENKLDTNLKWEKYIISKANHSRAQFIYLFW